MTSTYSLWMTEGGICQDTERNRPTEGHSHTGGGRGRDLSGHEGNRPSEGHSRPENSRGRDFSGYGKKSTKQGALTNWRQEREGLFRTWKETDQTKGTHKLEMVEGEACQNAERNRSGEGTHSLKMVEGGTCQDTERKRPSEGHSLPGDGRGRGLSGHGKSPSEQGALTFWGQQRERLVRTRK